jgi:predicted nucleic acid-binding protein
VTVCYLDASALVKLATRETESDALRRELTGYSDRLTSRLATVEVPRALARRGPETAASANDDVAQALEAVTVIEIDEELASVAAGLEPGTLRSLDAIHLASALALGEELEAFVTYDTRLGKAARAAGLNVVMPGST